LPGAAKAGLDNNTYTNVMVVWLLKKALFLLKGKALRSHYRQRLLQNLHLTLDDISVLDDIVKKMTVVFHKDGFIWSQFQGYEDLKDLDWDTYRKKYGNIERMDRILKAEGNSPDDYKLSKQPDVCMLFYLLTRKELTDIFTGLGYPFDESTIHRNISYYLDRTSHGSTLSKMVFSYILQKYEPDNAWSMFLDSARSDIDDTQEGTTGEGVHLALMGGSLYTIIRRYAGVDVTQKILRINPTMPKAVGKIKCTIQFRGVLVRISVSHKQVKAKATSSFFPLIVQGVTMLASNKPFKRRIFNQPLGQPYPTHCLCDGCKTSIPIDDDHLCRSCGKDMCTSCLHHHIGWYKVLIPNDPDIKICNRCATSVGKNDVSSELEDEGTTQKRFLQLRVRDMQEGQLAAQGAKC